MRQFFWQYLQQPWEFCSRKLPLVLVDTTLRMDIFFSQLRDLFLHIDAWYCRRYQVVRLFSLDVSDSKNDKQQPEEHKPYDQFDPVPCFTSDTGLLIIQITINWINATNIWIIFLNKIRLCYINLDLFRSAVLLLLMVPVAGNDMFFNSSNKSIEVKKLSK